MFSANLASTQWTVEREELVVGDTAPTTTPAPPLSTVDRIASPATFVTLALAYADGIDNYDRLRAAVAAVVRALPTFGCRAACCARTGEWRLVVPPEAPAAGALLLTGTGGDGASLADVTGPLPPPALAEYADAGAALFPGVPATLPPPPPPSSADDDSGSALGTAAAAASSAGAASSVPLFAVARYTLRGGGAVLAVRAGHIIADFGTIATALRILTAAYDGRPPPPPLLSSGGGDGYLPAAPAVAAIAAASEPVAAAPDFEPFNYLHVPPEWWAAHGGVFAGATRATAFHIPAARLAALKAEAAEFVAASAASASAASASAAAEAGLAGQQEQQQEDHQQQQQQQDQQQPAYVSTHDALVAHVWRTLSQLPSRRDGGGHPPPPLTFALDMRGRMEPGLCGVSLEDQARLVGNLATTALVPPLDVARGGPDGGPMPLGAVALAVRRGVAASAARFAGDVAHARRVDLGAADPKRYGGPGVRALMILPVKRMVEDIAAGRTPLVMTSAWLFDVDGDGGGGVRLGGQPPLAVAPCVSVPFPLVVTVPAAAAGGGGVTVHVWLGAAEHAELRACAAAWSPPGAL